MPRWTLFLLVFLLSGCLSSGSDLEPRIASAEGEDGKIINWIATTQADRQANELTIAVHPDGPNIIAVSGKDYTPAEAGSCVWDGLYVTTDGGQTWEQSNVPGSNWRLTSDPTTYQPDPLLSKFWCATDPVLAFGPSGRLIWSVMPYQCDPISGSDTGRGILPDGGFNDWFWTCSSMYVLTSTDLGQTWDTITEVTVGPRLEHDKQWLDVRADGQVMLCWDRDPTYQLTTLLDAGNVGQQLSEPGYVQCAVSEDEGQTWSAPYDVNPVNTYDGFLPWVAYDVNGDPWMAVLDSMGQVLVAPTLYNGPPTVIGTYVNPQPGGEYGWPVLDGQDFRCFALPSLAFLLEGEHAGNGLVAWMTMDGEKAELALRVLDAGSGDWKTVSGPKSSADMFMPAVTAGPDGIFDVFWYDRKVDAGGQGFSLYHSASSDGGFTWTRPLRVQDALVDPNLSHHQNGMVFMGDYIDATSGDGFAMATFVDTRNGKADAAIVKVER